MLIPREQLQALLRLVLQQRLHQGADLDSEAFEASISAAGDSYDALYELARALREPPLRADWPYCEPLRWDEITVQAEHLRPGCDWRQPDFDKAANQVRAGFLGSICGCMLGKPIEVDPSLAELRAAAGDTDGWPLADYVSTGLLERLGRRHESWRQTVTGSAGSSLAAAVWQPDRACARRAAGERSRATGRAHGAAAGARLRGGWPELSDTAS